MGMEYKIDIAGMMYGMEDLFSVTITQPLFEQLSVGNACSAELKLLFLPKGTVPRMAQITPYARKTAADPWRKLGVFHTDTRIYQYGLLEIVAYDEMLKAETVWEPDQNLEFPMTMPKAAEILAGLMGVEIDPRTTLNLAYTLDYPANDYTLRDVLRYIAAAHGGNWIITAEGNLLLVPLFSEPEETNHLVDEHGNTILLGGVRITV